MNITVLKISQISLNVDFWIALVKTFRLIYNLIDLSNVRISCRKVFKFAYFVEFINGYQPARFQCCRLSVSSFTEGLQKQNNDIIMTLFHNFGIENFHIL